MATGRRNAGLAWLLLPIAAAAQPQGEMARIVERLDRLERENRQLSEQVRRLEARLGAATAAEAPAAPAAAETPPPPQAAPVTTTEERLEILERRVEEQAQTKVETSQKFPVQLTGMALFNAFMDSRQSGGSDYPVVAAATGAGHAGATVRQSIVGLEFRDPAAVWGGKVHGSIYMDFFSGTTSSQFRVRTATIQIDWKGRSIAAGLEKPIFNPREPASLAQVGISPLTGAGNLWLWLPQFRVEQEIAFTRSTGVRAQIGAVQTREIGAYTGNVTAEAARPAIEGRFNFYHRLDGERRLEMAGGFHSSTTHAGGVAIPSHLVSLDWFFNPWKRLEFSGAYYSGTNVAHLGSGTRQGFGLYDGALRGIESMGGWGQVTIHLAPRWDTHWFAGVIDDDNEYLIRGAIGRNLMYGGNVYFKLAPNVIAALEATQLRTLYLGQGLRINNHYDLALAYFF